MVSRNFPPLIGGMEKLNYHLFVGLNKYFDVAVSGPKGCGEYISAGRIVEFSSAPLWRFVIESLFNTFLRFFRSRFDVVFCGSGTAIVAGYFLSKFSSSRLVCYLHGLDIIADHAIYKIVFLPLIRRADFLLVNSEHSRSLAIKMGVAADKISILHPGVEIPNVNNSSEIKSTFRADMGMTGVPILLIAGRITPRKGIAEFIQHVMPALLKNIPTLQLLIVGGEAVNAIKVSTDTTSKIMSTIESLGMEKNIKILGPVDDITLSAAYCAADLMVFPVLELVADVEGFGMVAIEAAARGLPTVGFAVGGVPDAIGDQESGWLVAPNDYAEMTQKISNYLYGKTGDQVTTASCIHFSKKFAWGGFEGKLRDFIYRICMGGDNKY